MAGRTSDEIGNETANPVACLRKVLFEVFASYSAFFKSGLCSNALVTDADHLGWLQDLPDYLKA